MSESRKEMEPNGESGNAVVMDMGLPMDMVAEEVVTQDDCGTDSDGQTVPVDSLTAHPAVSILNKFGKELGYLDDSSDDEGEPDADSAGSRLYVSGQNAAEEGSGDVWMGSVKDDCLCWECGERFNSLDLLMEHFRMHKACVRCNMCQVTFRRVVSLSLHLDNVHNNVDLRCASCHCPFQSKWDLNEHLGKRCKPKEWSVTLQLLPPRVDHKQPEECLVMRNSVEVKPLLEHHAMSESTSVPVPVSRAITVSADIPMSALKSQTVPASASASRTISVSTAAPVPTSVSKTVPVSAAVQKSATVSTAIPVSIPGSASVPHLAPVSAPVPAPVPIPIYLPLAIPVSLPLSLPMPMSGPMPGANSVTGPVSAPSNISLLKSVSVPSPISISMPSPSSTLEDPGSPLDEATLTELVARDHSYNNRCKAGKGEMASTYSLRMRQTKTLSKAKALPQQSQIQRARQKKIDLFLSHSIDQQQEKRPRVDQEEKNRHVEEYAEEEEDVKPETSSLIPPLPDFLASLGQGVKIKQESLDSRSKVMPWDGEPIEEDEDVEHSEEEVQSDEMASYGDDSEYDPGSASDVSTESISSGNSSGSSYNPKKRQSKTVRTRNRLRVKKLSKAWPSQVVIAPARQPDAIDSVKCHQSSIDQPNSRSSIQAAVKQNVPPLPAPVSNISSIRPVLRPSRMYACDQCREVFPEQVSYRRHHCPMNTAALISWNSPASISAPVTTVATVQNPTVVSILAPGAQRTIRVPSVNTLVSMSGPVPSSNCGVMKVINSAVPCSVQSSTPASTVPVASGPAFTLPSIVLPNPSPSEQSGSVPVMATVVFEGHGSSRRVTRLVLQSQGLTFPMHTQSQTPPIRLSLPKQTSACTPGQASPSLQLANLMRGGLIQPQRLVKSPHPTVPSVPSPVPAPVYTPSSAPIPAPALVPAVTPTMTSVNSVVGPALASESQFMPATAPIAIPPPVTGPTTINASVPSTVPTSISASLHMPDFTHLSATFPTPAVGPLRILGMFANCSQEMALKKRLEKNWRSKGVFLCRQCGAVSRQPSLGVRHRYLHRGSRRHRCHCGRTFLHRLHLLRHHVQHAEATRFVCAPCGQTFSGARCLARHKQDQKKRRRERSRNDCHAPFSCDCGRMFHRPTAFLWHKLINPKQLEVGLKRKQIGHSNDHTADQVTAPPLQ